MHTINSANKLKSKSIVLIHLAKLYARFINQFELGKQGESREIEGKQETGKTGCSNQLAYRTFTKRCKHLFFSLFFCVDSHKLLLHSPRCVGICKSIWIYLCSRWFRFARQYFMIGMINILFGLWNCLSSLSVKDICKAKMNEWTENKCSVVSACYSFLSVFG